MNYDFIWDDVPRRIRKGNFLPIGPVPAGAFINNKYAVGSFISTDHETLYNENLLTQPKDWFYRDNPIEYKLNKYGYRTAEFDTIDWSNSIVVFGCSNVFGVGLHEEDTLSGQLAKLTNIPVINMGVNASSIEYSLYNSIILNEHYPTPKAVIQVHSSIDRTTYYDKKNVTHHTPRNIKQGDYMSLYTTDPTHARVHAMMCQMINKQIWASKTRYYETSFFIDKFNTLNLNQVRFQDYARDLMHPGRTTLQNLAIKIKDKLEL